MSDKWNSASCQNLKRDGICNVGLFKQLAIYLSEHARKSGGGELLMNGTEVQYFRRSIRWNWAAKKWVVSVRLDLERTLNSERLSSWTHIKPVLTYSASSKATTKNQGNAQLIFKLAESLSTTVQSAILTDEWVFDIERRSSTKCVDVDSSSNGRAQEVC